MSTDYIPKEKCVDRAFYRIRSRNLTYGVYSAETGGFIGLREKFGQIYLFEEYHWDNGPPYGTVTPQEKLDVMLPESFLLAEHFPGSWCSICKQELKPYVDTETHEREPFTHINGAPRCENSHAFIKGNDDLFGWVVAQIALIEP
jgi:hypothetical protein